MTNNSAQERKRVTGIIVFFVLFFSLFGITAFLLSFSSIFDQWGTSITEKDFDSQRERVKFVNSFLPIPLPPKTTVKSIQYDSWLDWHLETVIDLPTDAGKGYVDKLQSNAEIEQTSVNNTAEFRYTNTSEMNGDIVFNEETETLRIECFN